jgi:hypothetical protein
VASPKWRQLTVNVDGQLESRLFYQSEALQHKFAALSFHLINKLPANCLGEYLSQIQ